MGELCPLLPAWRHSKTYWTPPVPWSSTFSTSLLARSAISSLRFTLFTPKSCMFQHFCATPDDYRWKRTFLWSVKLFTQLCSMPWLPLPQQLLHIFSCVLVKKKNPGVGSHWNLYIDVTVGLSVSNLPIQCLIRCLSNPCQLLKFGGGMLCWQLGTYY